MRFIDVSEYQGQGYMIDNVYSRMFDDLIARGANINQDLLAKAVNSVNNQGIELISIEDRLYIKDSVKLPLSSLSTGERLFLLAAVATELQLEIYLYRVLNQLSRLALLHFYETFGDSEYVNILDSAGYYEAMKRKRCLYA